MLPKLISKFKECLAYDFENFSLKDHLSAEQIEKQLFFFFENVKGIRNESLFEIESSNCDESKHRNKSKSYLDVNEFNHITSYLFEETFAQQFGDFVSGENDSF